MSSRWVYFLGILAISSSINLASAQLPPVPPGPLPPPTPLPAPNTVVPVVPDAAPVGPPASTATASVAPAAGGITVTTPGPVSSGTATPIIPGGCIDSCMPKGCAGGWSVGGGVYVLQPFFGNNPAFFVQKAGGGTTTTRQQDFSSEVSVAPLAYLSYTGAGGWGVRGRWFDLSTTGSAGSSLTSAGTVFDASGVSAFSVTPPAGDKAMVAATSHLALSVVDLEITKAWSSDRWSVIASAGARYAHLTEDYNISVTDLTTKTSLGSSNASHNFTGFGPTMALEGHYQIGASDFALYGSGRASVLFGNSDQTTGAGDGAIVGSSSSTSIIPIGEIEMGAEWAHNYGRYRLSAQVGLVGQVWFGGGNASQGIYLNTLGSGGSANGNASNFGLLGGVVRAGISF